MIVCWMFCKKGRIWWLWHGIQHFLFLHLFFLICVWLNADLRKLFWKKVFQVLFIDLILRYCCIIDKTTYKAVIIKVLLWNCHKKKTTGSNIIKTGNDLMEVIESYFPPEKKKKRKKRKKENSLLEKKWFSMQCC